jgi:hypothetical protein
MSDKLNRKTIFNLMPGRLMREIVVRKLGRLDLGLPEICFKIASSSTEIAKAINLVDDCYVARGILDREQKRVSTHTLPRGDKKVEPGPGSTIAPVSSI